MRLWHGIFNFMKNKWNKSSEKVPVGDDYVLTFFPEHESFEVTHISNFNSTEMTYWMPLPESPEVEVKCKECEKKDLLIEALKSIRECLDSRLQELDEIQALQAEKLGFWCKECEKTHIKEEGDYSGDPLQPYPGWPHIGCPPWSHACFR